MSFSTASSSPNDKSVDLPRHGYEDLDSEFFDQFLTFSPGNCAGQDFTGSSNQQITEGFSSNSDIIDTPASIDNNAAIYSNDHQSQLRNPWAAEPPAASSQYNRAPTNGFYSETSGRAAVSDSELLTLEGISLYSPQIPAFSQSSLPTTPLPSIAAGSRRKARLVESISKTFKKATGNLQSSYRTPIRKTSSLPKMARHSNHSQNNFDHWEDKLPADAPKFKFEFEENPTSLSFEISAATASMAEEQPDHLTDNDLPRNITTPTTHDTPQATPELCGGHSRKTSSNYFPITPQLHNSASFWPSTPAQPDLNTFEGSAVYPPSDVKMPIWWNDASAAPMAQPLPVGFHTNPQLATRNLVHQLQNDLEYGNNERSLNSMNMTSGLMIQIPQAPTQQPLMMENVPRVAQHGSQDADTPPQPHHVLRRQTAQIFSRQPQQSAPSQMHPTRSNDSEPSSPGSSSSAARQRKSPKTSRKSWSRAQHRPKSGGAVDFVNYTPDDSRKILTGVAPSGSSKTKARRDKEAMDKRRRLSQAALRAVKAAGGDVNSLVEEGLFV
ncbi:uncharacterized protein BP5553_03411 [Venustampulla echinocandica]|uniref:Developmental regulatory protein wetA n=1 Tax=Venustampulla echinocandica TaxID=2656787 RepID=A0A370TU68_9HELO|nr:uncharacterized protein BP5553_03411 [Venustampulla echinocandica]RDL39071.1 hypothetical protein BP5553_03411 [Venustampulla echinocandica]